MPKKTPAAPRPRPITARVTLDGLMSVPVTFDGAAPPTEIRLFRAGENETSKGPYVFDEQAAADVMAAYALHCVPGTQGIMFDLEHLSLDKSLPRYDGDARAWCDLEVRNGELWATNIKWTSDGVARLTNKTQRYLSPAFLFDKETRRVFEIHNIALTASPATNQATQLIAASKPGKVIMAATSTGGATSGPGLPAIAAVLGLAEDCTLADVVAKFKEIFGPDAFGSSTPASTETDPSVDGGAMAASKAAVAAHRELLATTGESNSIAALSKVKTWRDNAIEMEKQKAALVAEKQILETKERRELVTKLVTLGAEVPATAWVDPTKDPLVIEPAEPWASISIEKLRGRVTALSAGRQTTSKTPVRETSNAPNPQHQTGELSATDKELATLHKVPEPLAKSIREQVNERHNRAAGRV